VTIVEMLKKDATTQNRLQSKGFDDIPTSSDDENNKRLQITLQIVRWLGWTNIGT